MTSPLPTEATHGMAEQPEPTGQGQPITELVVADLLERSRVGTLRYGTPLRAHNGRDALLDSYHEALDLCQYLRQALEERQQTGDGHIIAVLEEEAWNQQRHVP